jgi:hypothetical protein
MRQRMMLKTPFWRSAMRQEFPLLYLSARASVFIAIGRWQLILILRHGSDMQPGSLPNCDVVALNTSALRTSRQSFGLLGRTIASNRRRVAWQRKDWPDPTE